MKTTINTTMKTLVMNFVQSRGYARRKDIVKFIHEVKGLEFNPVRDRGYWSTAFVSGICKLNYSNYWTKCREGKPTYTSTGYFCRPSKNEKRYLVQDRPYGPYHVVKELPKD